MYSIFTGIVITSGLDAVQYDFCEKVGVNLSGNVYHDRDDDGNFDRPGEEGIGGVVLKLLDAQRQRHGPARHDRLGRPLQVHQPGGRHVHGRRSASGRLARRQGHARQPGRRGRRFAAGRHDQPDHAQLGRRRASSTTSASCCPARSAAASMPTTARTATSTIRDIMLEGVQIDLLDANGNVLATTYTERRRRVRVHRPARRAPTASASISRREYFDGGERVGTAGGTKSRRRRRSTASSPASTSRSGFRRDSIRLLREAAGLDQRPRACRSSTRTATSTIRRFCSKACAIDLLDADGNVVATTLTNAARRVRLHRPARRATTRSASIQPTEYYDGGERVGSVGRRVVRRRRTVQHVHRHRARATASTRSSTTSARRSA